MYTAGPWRLHFHRPVLMGIVNVTPDSFSDGGQHADPAAAIAQGHALIAEGADWLDIGGESTRPGAAPISPAEEQRRIVPVIEGLAEAGVPLSVDTRHAATARAAVAAGAAILNDITGGADPQMGALAAERGLAYIVMHMQGDPRTMQTAPAYDDVVAEVFAFLGDRCERLKRQGVTALLTDPGLGFGKTLAHNLRLMRQLDWLLELGYPICLGASRKSWIAKASGRELPMAERIEGSLAAAVLTLERGVRVFRVHDVAAHRRALQAAWGIMLAEEVEGNGPVPWPAVVERAG